MNYEHISLMDSYFDFLYAKAISIKSCSVFEKMCEGCENGYLSQRCHTCLSLSKRERLELYFDEILKDIDEEDVLIQWTEAVNCLDDISSELIYMYKLKLSCKDWRETDMKTQCWKTRMIKMVNQIWLLERSFTATE